MKNPFYFLFLFFGFSCFSQTNPDLQSLRSKIDSTFSASSGTFALAFKDLSGSNDSLLINENENFHAASTMKTPVMIEIFNQVQEGKFSLSDSLLIRNEFKSIVDGSKFSLELARDGGEKLYDSIGTKVSIGDLVRDMIINSSNLATNLLIELVDAKNVNRKMRMMGAEHINVLRGVEDMKAYEAGLSNSTTAYDLMLIFEHLANGTAVNQEADSKMISILLDQHHRDVIPAKLPKDLKIANKTGWITGVHHDSAIVYLPDGRKYVLVLLSKEMDDMEKGTEMLANISKLVYDYMIDQGS